MPDELRSLVRRTVDLRGVSGAARVLGVSRTVVLAVEAGHDVLPGSIALLRLAYQRSELASESAAVATTFDPEVA